MADCEANWLRANEPETWARDPPLPAAVGLPDPPADRAVRRLDARRRSASCRSTTSARRGPTTATGSGSRRRSSAAWLPELVAADRAPRVADRRRGRGDRAARRAAGHRRRRRQGLRGPRLRGADAGRREPVVRHDRHDQHHDRPLHRADPLRAALPGRGPGRRTRWRSRSTAATGWSSGSSASSATTRSPARRPSGRRARGAVRRPRPGGAGRARWGSPSSRTGRPACAIPGPEAKGAIIGFGDVHTRAHVYRAIIEGLAYALRDGAERTAKRTGVPLTVAADRGRRLAESGGGPAHRRRLRAAGRARRTRTRRPGSGRRSTRRSGSASTADVPTAAAAMVRVGEVRDPDPATHALYDELYRGVYRRMYRRLQPLYRRSGGSRAIRRPDCGRYARPNSDLMPGWLR